MSLVTEVVVRLPRTLLFPIMVAPYPSPEVDKFDDQR